MKCEKCNKNEANVYYKETVNGKTKSYSLCQECFDEMQKNGQLKMEMSNFWAEPFDDFFGNDFFHTLLAPMTTRSVPAQEKRCSLCGASFEDIVSEGKVGCPKCYDVFENELEESVRRIHGTTSHTGRTPGKLKAKFDRKKKLFTLEKQLKDAIKEERYEDAAKIRDEIRDLKNTDDSQSA